MISAVDKRFDVGLRFETVQVFVLISIAEEIPVSKSVQTLHVCLRVSLL
mgnify:CR=1 FL=1